MSLAVSLYLYSMFDFAAPFVFDVCSTDIMIRLLYVVTGIMLAYPQKLTVNISSCTSNKLSRHNVFFFHFIELVARINVIFYFSKETHLFVSCFHDATCLTPSDFPMLSGELSNFWVAYLVSHIIHFYVYWLNHRKCPSIVNVTKMLMFLRLNLLLLMFQWTTHHLSYLNFQTIRDIIYIYVGHSISELAEY